ncbi:hypothetical protein P8625_08225 [Tenacibaculum tangerinum]|uniref:Tetratricopeptide repeat protein n=1 Tax=Tenacibaculum tangerinum TaxID=3038772 RepID=A0ABY8KXY6_9FLAO|nr:hypothetical protein [Tenacibaculum tangerinum]WGH74107.1 hypothetical protein P8625_08225 [Tenacibaculum tangerinum]
MNKDSYIQLLEKPELVSQEQVSDITAIIQKYPYFQSARALRLKILKNQESYKYNNELKITAAHTSDRSVLFDFITSKVFKEVSQQEPKITLKEKILPKRKPTKVTDVEEDLAIGKPLSFTKNETFSFNQWLQLSSKKAIIRTSDDNKPLEKQVDENPEQSEQDAIIDRFIKTAPKISRPNKTIVSDVKITENKQNNPLATETLAKVYLEQKKYDSAIQAYKILSLKYPEKSGFFADQIKRIQILQNNK